MPQLTNNSAAFGAPQGVTFDTAGDLWVIDGGTVAAGGKVPPGLDEFTPAQLAALKTTPNPTDQDIDRAMAGNICRCGTYQRIRAAIHTAAKERA